MRYTAAHWGCYTFEPSGEATALHPVEDDPKPSDIGDGWLSGAFDPGVRVRQPAVRRGWLEARDRKRTGDDPFVEVSWDTALDLVADELKRVRATHGNKAIFAGSYGWASAGRFHHAQSHLRRFMNLIGGYTGARTTYSHAAAEVLFPYITGCSNSELQEQMTGWPEIVENCELMLSFGGISGRTAQIASSGTSLHEVESALQAAVQNGMAVIGVTPDHRDLQDLPGAEWVPIRPGTDVAFMLALAFEIHAAGQHDRAFLARCTSGWETFESYLTGASDGQPKSADWAAPITDVSAEVIRSIARRLPVHRTMVSLPWGLQRAHHGEQPIWAALTLAAMLGQIGQPGTGFGFGYGSVTPVGRASRSVRWPSVPQGRNPVSSYIPVARIADALLCPGEAYPFDGTTLTYPDLRLVYWAGGNPYHHHQDLFRLEEAWCRPETVVVQDHSWTATARRADIVLPATTPLERTDIMMNKRDPALIYMSPKAAPLAGARNDHDIFADLAARFELREAFTEGRSEEEWLRWLWRAAMQAAEQAGFTLPDFEAFREMGRVQVPSEDIQRVLFARFVADPDAEALSTESGRLQLASDRIAGLNLPDCPGHASWLPPVEGQSEVAQGALHLLSPQPRARLHAQLDSGAVSQASKINGREPCRLHPATAARFGISDGDVVRIQSARGACLAGAVLDEALREDCVSLATGAWFDPQEIDGQRIDVHGNPNALTMDQGASGLSQGNIAHTATVRIARYDGPLPDLRVHRQPRFLSQMEG